jgi:hypothetical protein
LQQPSPSVTGATMIQFAAAASAVVLMFCSRA